MFLGNGLQAIERQEEVDRQFHFKREALSRGSLGTRFVSEGASLQSKPTQYATIRASTLQETPARSRRRPAAGSAVAFTDFLRATTMTATPSTTIIPTPSGASVACPKPISSITSLHEQQQLMPSKEQPQTVAACPTSPEDLRRQTANLRNAAFAHFLRPPSQSKLTSGPPPAGLVPSSDPPTSTSSTPTPPPSSSPGASAPTCQGPEHYCVPEALPTSSSSLLTTIQLDSSHSPSVQCLAQCSTSTKSASPTGTTCDYPEWLCEGPNDDEDDDDFGFVTVERPLHVPRETDDHHCGTCSQPLALAGWSPGPIAHRCALCAETFCHQCSSYWTIIHHAEPGQKKQRACRGCHMRVTGNLTPHPTLLEPRGCPDITKHHHQQHMVDDHTTRGQPQHWQSATRLLSVSAVCQWLLAARGVVAM